MKRIVLLTTLIALFSVAKAQDYQTGIGLRAGYYNGITIKHFISGNDALEGIISSRWRGLTVTGLYERTINVPTPRLHFYYGAGAHVGFWSGYKNHPWFNDNVNHTVIGIDGILGVEYNFEPIPLNLSLDWKPEFNLIGYNGFIGDGFALSIRYIF